LYLFFHTVKYGNGLGIVTLRPNGLEVSSNVSTSIQFENKSNSPVFSRSVCHFKRGVFDYLIFHSRYYELSLRIARSAYGILGPYEIHKDPLIQGYFWDPTLVQDTVGDQDVLIFGSKSGIFASRLIWRDDWPSAVNFEKRGRWVLMYINK